VLDTSYLLKYISIPFVSPVAHFLVEAALQTSKREEE
jgi:hypothetical protein